MPNPEKLTSKVETAAEVSRETLEHRGEKTLEAKAQVEEAEKAKRIAELRAQIAEEDAKIAEIDAKLAELDAKEAEKTSETITEEENTTGDTEAGAENEETSETEDDSVEKTSEKGKKSPGLKKLLITATAIILAGTLGVGAVVAQGFGKKKNPAPSPNPGSKVESVVDNGEEAEKIGIYDGYGEKGMWLSENKTGPYNFANAAEVAEACKNDECEMIKYTAENQVESFADYMANLPEELQPEGFKGLSIIETERKLESLSDEEYEAIQKQFNETIDNAFTRRVVLNGRYDNAYMSKKDPSGEAVHDNMQVVRCVTNENNLEVTQFFWTDAEGKEIGNMTVKMSPVYDENGEQVGFRGCNQAVNEQGNSPIYEDLPEVEDPDEETPPENPEEKPVENPEETPKPKNPENQQKIIEEAPLTNPVEQTSSEEVERTPVTTEPKIESGNQETKTENMVVDETLTQEEQEANHRAQVEADENEITESAPVEEQNELLRQLFGNQ
ncbi:MAG: hypothetical protein Q4B29_00580 [Candidatus Saccharibacteria bacterium]|nr:hypothetical protein [Candidatus Saccharibacteria bacterium]